MKTRILLTMLSLLLSVVSRAATEIDGIYYNLYSSSKTAAVTSGTNKYTGDVTIPAMVSYNSVDYAVKSIGNYAFQNCTGLTAVNIPNSVNSIGYDAFARCQALNSITIPGSVKTIGRDAFYRCDGLTSVVINDGVTSLGDFVFAYCSKLTSITIPNSVESIGNYAFENTPWLNSQPEGDIVYVGNVAYMYNGYMPSNTSVILKEGTTTLQSKTFERCSGLVSITLPSSLTNIGSYAFRDCTGLATIVVDAGNSKYDSREDCNAIIETSTNSLIAGCMNTVIPNSVTSIGNNAFYNCSGLTSLTIPSGVTSIESGAFTGCNGLVSIVVDAGNSKYDSRENCNAIIETSTNSLIAGCKNTVIPNSVTSIGGNVFYNCSGLTSISIPSGVESIGYCSFANCSDLADVYCYAEKVPTTEKGAFDGVGEAILHVPASAVETYRAMYPWSNFKEVVAIEETTSSITVLASQQTDEQDELFKKVYWDGEKMVYPVGYENYDNKLNFLYAKESGIYSDYSTPTLSKASWNYPGELLSQLKSANSNNTRFAVDYDFIYDGDGFDFVDGRYRSLEDSILVQVSPADMELTNAEISLLNTKGEDVIDAGFVELAGVKRYNEEGLWTIKFRLNNAKMNDLLGDDSDYLEDNYAVVLKVMNNNVVSDYNLSLGLKEIKRAYDFNVNDVSVAQIHNRYIKNENINWHGDNLWTDDSDNFPDSFCNEMTWHGDAYSSILFKSDLDSDEQLEFNACDRHGHSVTNQRETSGTDNRHVYPILPTLFNCEIDGAEWAKIDIEFPTVNENGDYTPIRGFFVMLDQNFARESSTSEVSAWTQYIYKNVGFFCVYGYDVKTGKFRLDEERMDAQAGIENGIRKAHLFKGNKGTICIKNARGAKGDVIGFRVYAVNLDGTLTDPDGRAFYVEISNVEIEEEEDELQRYLDSLTDTEDELTDNVYRREFKNGNWQALYVPFEMDYSDWSDKFEVARVSGFRMATGEGLPAGLEGGVLEATMVESGKVEANYPYLIRAKSKYGATLTVNVTGDVNMTSGTTAFAPASIIGNYEKMYKMNTYQRYRLQGGSLSIPNSDDEMLPPFRWFVRGPENQASRLSIEINGEEVTGIDGAIVSGEGKERKVYDLQGRKVNGGMPQRSGIYIINNKCVFK